MLTSRRMYAPEMRTLHFQLRFYPSPDIFAVIFPRHSDARCGVSFGEVRGMKYRSGLRNDRRKGNFLTNVVSVSIVSMKGRSAFEAEIVAGSDSGIFGYVEEAGLGTHNAMEDTFAAVNGGEDSSSPCSEGRTYVFSDVDIGKFSDFPEEFNPGDTDTGEGVAEQDAGSTNSMIVRHATNVSSAKPSDICLLLPILCCMAISNKMYCFEMARRLVGRLHTIRRRSVTSPPTETEKQQTKLRCSHAIQIRRRDPAQSISLNRMRTARTNPVQVCRRFAQKVHGDRSGAVASHFKWMQSRMIRTRTPVSGSVVLTWFRRCIHIHFSPSAQRNA
ncbi:uncharacterized protein FOMMEDRAFT_154568 [Fomitiporia mediterranea MF3/22]|uniref:uncharacterized protein n=1 Tax=Fomitiporia mediterranea (strain MF3/22) TaxID=694068 RepID=UPI0004409C4A|nr:uncharacterized protein FOMMEDRAFT_154568 [Fomitiporia mediterranea MF3/22]EJD03494.1 hypothetical protein FOMMEDRAFT_154568 [Fomitiporia mediterranea MF3/22]